MLFTMFIGKVGSTSPNLGTGHYLPGREGWGVSAKWENRSSATQGTHCTGKTGKIAQKNSLSGKTQVIWKFCPKHRENTENLFCSSCTFPDSKGKRFFDICHGNFQINFEAG